jgi:DNA adenine methylase
VNAIGKIKEKAFNVEPWLLWAGGKRSLAPRLVAEIMATNPTRYVEPFLGGGAVALALPSSLPKILADVNHHLIDCWLCMQKMPGNLLAELREVERIYGNTKDGYLTARSEFNSMINHPRKMWVKRSALFTYLNARCFNGLWRVNRRGEFNVPFGRYVRIGYTHDFTPYKDAFQNWKFTHDDFETIRLAHSDFVYADPPYDVEFTTYSKGGFSWEDQIRTAEWLARHKGPVILVNQATPRINELYRKLEYDVRFLDSPRRISCNGDRTPAQEILATRNL